MFATLVVPVSVTIVVFFFVTYRRSLLPSSSAIVLSEESRSVTGMRNGAPAGEDFRRVLQLPHLRPGSEGDEHQVAAVRVNWGLDLQLWEKETNRSQDFVHCWRLGKEEMLLSVVVYFEYG